MQQLKVSTGGQTLKVATGGQTMQTGSLVKGLFFWCPMTTGWMQTATTLSDKGRYHLHPTVVDAPTVGADYTTFNGTSDAYQIEDSATDYFAFDGTTDFTISVYIKTTDTSGTIFGHRTTNGYNPQLLNGSIDFFTDDATGNKNYFTNSTFNDNVWHSVQYVWNTALTPNFKQIYVDGVLQAATGSHGTATFGQAGLDPRIAAAANVAGTYAGSLRDVMIWDRILTTAEHQLLYDLMKSLNLS